MNRQCLTLHCHCRFYFFGRTWPTRTCSSHNFCTCWPDLRLFGWCAGNLLIYVHAFNAPELVEIKCTVWNAINLDGLKRKKKCVWRVYLNHSTVIEFHCIKVYERKSHRDCFTHRFIFMCFWTNGTNIAPAHHSMWRHRSFTDHNTLRFVWTHVNV